MPDAIDNLVQDINQANPSGNQGKMYLVGDQYLPFGALVPNMAGVRVGDKYVNDIGDSWNWDANDYDYAPSTLGTGGEMDYNVRDQPVERINDGNTDEKDAFVRTGIGTTLDPKTEDFYGVKGLVSPGDLGGTIGVVDANPADFAGQTPSSLPEEFITRGETVKIPGRGLPDYIPIGQMENGDVLYADRNNLRDTIIRPSAYSISQEDLDKGIVPQKFNFGINTELAPSQKIPTSVGAYEGVGAVQPTTTSEGGFENTGGKITAGPGGVTVGPGGTINVTPDWKPGDKPKPKVENDIDGDGIPDEWKIFTGGKGKDDGLSDYRDPKTGDLFPTDQEGYKWNYTTKQFDCVGGRCSEKNPVKDTGTTPAPPAGGGTGTTPTPGGGTTPTPGGGVRPGTGTGTGTYTGTPLPPREPVTPLVRRETVIPTKGTKEVPLPDRQADPFAQIYADLLANAQQQEDRYRYINYDPDQIMNAAMSGFRRRGAMRSLQGY
jgi:hypothetical protein